MKLFIAGALTLLLTLASEPTIVLNVPADQELMANYRNTDYSDFQELRISGSAQFTPAQLVRFKEGSKKGPLTVFDLRQENHGFINGNAVTWYSDRDWANLGKSHDWVLSHEKELLGGLKKAKKVNVPLAKEFEKDPKAPKQELTIKQVQSEEEVVRGAGASYVRLTVTDHRAPDDTEVDRFIHAVRALPKDARLHFHCSAGQGRTTTFMVMYDMLRNAKHLPMGQIVNRQAKLGRDYDVLAFDAKDKWKEPLQKERAAFVEEFYRYAKANPNGQGKTWSEWKKQQ